MPKDWKKASAVAALAVVAGWLFFRIPLVRKLVWLNAGAISAHFGTPGLFVPVAILELILIVGLMALTLWRGLNMFAKD